MADVNKKAFSGLASLIIIMAAALFLPAWSIQYWQAWFFLAVFSVSVFLITIYLIKKDPKLLERRVAGGPSAEKEKTQKIIQSLASVAFIAVLVIPALDHRFAWSSLPFYIIVAGDIFVASGLFIVFLVFKENSFTSATIEALNGQTIVSTGPYAVVRHPMYSGAVIMLAGIPLALGSWWGLLAVVPMVAVIVLRLVDEEKFMAKNFDDYLPYTKKTRYRLVPFIW
jgi:protein-S-isoprenylcysteine O-methyltransferase Ste14